MTNKDRAARARYALDTYKDTLQDEGLVDDETAITDLLTDLMHLCNQDKQLSLAARLHMSEIHFNEEKALVAARAAIAKATRGDK